MKLEDGVQCVIIKEEGEVVIKVKLMEIDIRTGFDTGITQYIHKDGAKVTEHAVSDIIEIELYDILHKIPITCSAQRLRIHLEKE